MWPARPPTWSDADCKLELAWAATAGSNGGIPSTPTVANGVVYYGDGFHGQLHAFDTSSGVELWTCGSEVAGPILATPIVVNGRLFAASYDNHLHAWGL